MALFIIIAFCLIGAWILLEWDWFYESACALWDWWTGADGGDW